MKVYGDKISGNCLKVKYVCDHLSVSYEWVDIDIMKGESRTPEFLARSPAGQVPIVELDDGRVLAQSNAIMLYIAEGSALVPEDPYERAKMHEWLFWEQYSHETAIAVCRFHMKYLGKSAGELDPDRVERGHKALAMMDSHLADSPWFVGSAVSLADIALVAYTRLSHEGGFDLEPYNQVRRWILDVERAIPVD